MKRIYRILTIATGASEGGEPNPAFAKGDPADHATGYDIAVTFNPNASPSEMYTVTPANEPSALTEEELFLLRNFEAEFDIEEYFKVRSREEVIEYLEKARDVEGFDFGATRQATSDKIEAAIRDATIATAEVENPTPPF